MNNLGRDKLNWSQDTGGPWDKIDQRVHDETAQTKVAARFLPLVPPDPNNMSIMVVPADTINPDTMTVDQGEMKPVLEIAVEFKLTQEQVDKEDKLPTGVTLATRAANLLSQAEDLLIFQGGDALNTSLFKKFIHYRGPDDPGDGLVQSGVSGGEAIPVPAIEEGKWGENTFAAVAKGYSDLQGKGQYGPYALVLPTAPYADTYAPLKDTLITPADRIKPLVTAPNGSNTTAAFYGTGTLPAFTGILVSLGGNTMDRVVGVDAITAFTQEDDQRLFRFRVFERFALRTKDSTAIVLLNFES